MLIILANIKHIRIFKLQINIKSKDINMNNI